MSIRTERVARLMQREIAELLVSEYSEQLPRLVTVTGARTTKDLSMVYVYVSVMGVDDAEKQTVFRQLQDLTPRLRTSLAARVRHQVRAIPELRFFLDDTLDTAARIDDLLDRIRRERDRRESD